MCTRLAPRGFRRLSGTLSSGIPLRVLESPSHRLVQTRDGPERARFALDASEKKGGNRDFVLRYRLAGDAIQSGLSLYDGGAEKFFLLQVEPSARVTCTLVLGFVARVPTPLGKLAFAAASAVFGYLATLVVNALRIVVSLSLSRDDFLPAFLSQQAWHRLEGIAAYLGSLGVLVLGVDALLPAGRRHSHAALGLLGAIYMGVTVIGPWLNGAAAEEGYARHAGVVVLSCLLLVGALAVLVSLRDRRAGSLERSGGLG